MVIARVSWFQDGGLGVFILCVTKVAIIEVAIISIKENHLIVYSGGAKYSGELVNVFKPTVYIHIPV